MNDITLIDTFTKEFEYSHTTNNINFYTSVLSVLRKSSVSDEIPIITQHPFKIDFDTMYYIHGELKVFNTHGHSKYYVYPDFTYSVNEDYGNHVELIGTVHTVSKKRKTPLNSHIKDVILDTKSTKIPLIFWNGLANLSFEVKQSIHIIGRLQSRTYIKNDISRTILEVSVSKII